MNNPQRILIAGGAGFIGSNLTKRLLEQGHAVDVVDNLITGRRSNLDSIETHPNLTSTEIDIVSPSFFETFRKNHYDTIFHLACPTGVPNIEPMAEEMIMTNSFGTLNILNIAREHNSRVIFTSTAEIYGQPEVFPQVEHYNGNVNPIGPRAPYEEGKRFSETLISMYVRKYGLRGSIVRIFNTYGPGMSLDDRRVIPQFIRSIITGDDIVIYGDGLQTRTHLFVEDLLNGILLVTKLGLHGEAYNIGGSEQITVRDLAAIILKLTRRENGIVFKEHFVEDHKDRRPSVEKVMQLGWGQTVSLEDGLRRMLTHHDLTV